MALRWEEVDALKEQYPADHVALLAELAALVDQVELRHMSAYEATVWLKSRFAKLMAEYVPESGPRIAEYRARVAAEKAELTRIAAEYEEGRVRAQRAEAFRISQAAEDAQAERYRSAREAEERLREQWRANYEQEETQRREKNEKDRLSAEEAAKEAERLLTKIEG